MGRLKDYIIMFHVFVVLNCFVIFNTAAGRTTTPAPNKAGDDLNGTDRIPIGVVFDQNTNQIQHAFKIAMVQHAKNNTNDYLNFQVFVDVINTADAFKLSRLVCNQFSRGVVAILAAVHPDSFDTFHSYANTFHMPFVTPFFPEKVLTPTSGGPDFAMSILPDYHKAVLETVNYYGWQNVIYLYDSHDGMLRLQQLFKSLVPGKKPFFRIANVKRINNAKDVIGYLRQLEKADRWSNKYVILDCTTTLAKDTLMTHVRDVTLGRRNYHYLFSGLVFDDRWDRDIREYGTINMTGFRVVDTSRKYVKDFLNIWKLENIAAKGALMYDAAHTVLESFQRLLKYKPHIIENLMNKTNQHYRFLSCDTQEATPLKYGDEIAAFIKRSQVEGLTGKIRFSSGGVRKNFSLVVVRNTPDGDMFKIATWYDDKGFRPVKKLHGIDTSGKYDRNKTYTVVSIQEPPYFTSSRPTIATDTAEDLADVQYEGFCADLAILIAEKLNINIQFRLAADGKYGGLNPNVIGGWDGMVGELSRKEIDMVVAPLIVTEERETVIDFSKPFLSFNRLNSKSDSNKNYLLAFLRPLSKETWILLACSILIVSTVLFVVARFSPMEWRVVVAADSVQALDATEANTPATTVMNDISFFNAVWYSLCSIMQQGNDVSPRSTSARIVSGFWWFFALMIVCSYTAYMASRLTINGLESTTPIYNRMANCPEDMNANKKGIIIDEEGHGNLDDTYIPEPRDYDGHEGGCEMLITVLDPGIKDFAVGFPKGSKLRTGVNLALTAIRAEGEMNRLLRKHFHKSSCDVTDETTQGGNELTLHDVVGLFYLLMFGMALGLFVASLEFCSYHRSGAAKAKPPVKSVINNSHLQVNEIQEARNTTRRRRRDPERWNGTGNAPGSYAGCIEQYGSSSFLGDAPQIDEPSQAICMCILEDNTLPAIPEPPAPYAERRELEPWHDSVQFECSAPRSAGVGRARRRAPHAARHALAEVREAIEMSYFTPANGPEEAALESSFTQV